MKNGSNTQRIETHRGGSSASPKTLPPRMEMVALSEIGSARRNARTHSKKQIRQLADSMLKFGYTNPVIIDDHNRLVAGHARADAARLIGLKRIPAIRLSHLSETAIRAYVLADNKLAENAGWDREILALELGELQVALPEIGLEVGITGFNAGDIDSIMVDFSDEETNPADEIPAMENETAVAQDGDIFVMGRHRLLAGDARDRRAYDRLMGTEPAVMAFLDPPYNVKVKGHVGGRGRIKHREFACASGEMTSPQYTQFLTDTLGLCSQHIVDGGISYVCIDWRHTGDLLAAGAEVYGELKNICVWAKTTPGQGTFYRSQHEFVFVFKQGDAAHLNTFELGQHGRTRSNVWTYAGVNTFRAGRMDELKMHPTVKPVALIADAMRDCSRRGSIILDAFAGSGSTIMAAEQIGRRAFCIELDPRYVDVAVRRWQQLTGRDAMLESTGQAFDELLEGRAAKALTVAKSQRRKVASK